MLSADSSASSTPVRRAIGRHHAGAAAVGEDDQLSRRGWRGKRASVSAARKSCLHGVHAQHAGARDGRVVDDVRAGHAPVCEAAARWPCAERPDFTTITGLLRAAARAADMNLRGARSTRCRAGWRASSHRCRGSRACRRNRRRHCSPSDTSARSRCRECAQSSMVVISAPDCATKASRARQRADVRSWRSGSRCGTSMPMQLGPRMRSTYAVWRHRAAAFSGAAPCRAWR